MKAVVWMHAVGRIPWISPAALMDVASLSSKGQTRRKAGAQSHGPGTKAPGRQATERIGDGRVGAPSMAAGGHGLRRRFLFSDDKRSHVPTTAPALAFSQWQGISPIFHFVAREAPAISRRSAAKLQL